MSASQKVFGELTRQVFETLQFQIKGEVFWLAAVVVK
jgi:hypothetical protein